MVLRVTGVNPFRMLAAMLLAFVTLRDVVVVNQTGEAIFTVKVGHASSATWSDDVLGFARVIDVSRGALVHLPVDAGDCVNDVQATLRSGRVVVVPQVNLCTVQQIDVKTDSN